MGPSQAAVRLTWWIARSLLVPALLLNPADAAEPERVSIQTLLSPQATSYQQHLVTLEGVTSALQIIQPIVGSYSLRSKPCLLYGRASFVLEDETGSLPVVVMVSCNPDAPEALPKDGGRVRVTGVVQVLKSEAPRDVRVQATAIQILDSH
jgi:hypothetical protein